MGRLFILFVFLGLVACTGVGSFQGAAGVTQSQSVTPSPSPSPSPTPTPQPNPQPQPQPQPSPQPQPQPNPQPQPGPTPTPTPTPSPSNPVRTSPSPGNWVNVTSNLVGTPSECGNMTFVSAKPTEDMMIAGIAKQGLFSSRDGGTSWQRLGTGAGSDQITNRTGNIIYDPANPNRWWEVGIYNDVGVFRTDNDGSTFKGLSTSHHNDSVSVDFTDPNRMTLLAGGHESRRDDSCKPDVCKPSVILSKDGGNSWTNVGVNLYNALQSPSSAFASYPLVINSTTYFIGMLQSWSGVEGGLYKTTDSGATWQFVTKQGGGAAPLTASDGSIYWVGNDGSLIRGVVSGSNVTWTQMSGAGTLAQFTPSEAADGRLIAIGGNHIMVSSNKGVTWQQVGPSLPFSINGFTYSNYDKAVYVWYFTCFAANGDAIQSDAIMKYWMN